MRTNMKEYALYYADKGLAVFPLEPRGKRPITKNGCKAATTNKDQISEWWDVHPNSNIGIATGKVSGGLLVIDLDEDEEKDKHGYEVLKEWQQANGEFPETWQSITGRGGYHLFFKDSAHNRNRANLYDGIDIRGDGGYIVAPPSVHPNGRRYEWEFSPEDQKLAIVDNVVANFLMGPLSQKDEQNFQEMENILEGQRVETLVKLIGSQRGKGLSTEAIRAAVKAENEARCTPPLTDQELEREVFPALRRDWRTEKHYAAVSDRGKSRIVKKTPQIEKASNVIIKEPEWLVPGYIPKYGITTIAGEGGVGKTSIWCSLVASITTGKQSFLLGGQIPFHNDPEDVLVLSAEDSWSYVLRARLEANGADLERISFISPEDDRFVDLNFDGELLRDIVVANKPDVIVFDPLQAFVPASLRMGDRNAMRKCFSPLIGYGEKYGVTTIIIAHANKQSGVWGRKRIADSSDIWDSSRSVLMTGMTKDEDVRYISHEKSNWGKLGRSVLFSLDECVPTFKAYTPKKDKDFIQEDARERNIRPAMEEAKGFIVDTLKEQKEMEVAELDDLAAANSISKNALKEAKAMLKREGITRVWSIGNGRNGQRKFIIALKDPGKPNE